MQDPPFQLNGSRTLMLALPARRDRLEAMCARTFGWAAPEVRVQPLGDTVLLFFTDVADATCADPRLGSFTYREATFFVPIVGYRGSEPFLALHVPFIYPNQGLAVAAGREIYGLPKKPATVEMPDFDALLEGDATISVRALAAARFDGSRWQERELVTVASAPQPLPVELEDAFLDAVDRLFGPFPGSLGPIGHLLEQHLVQLKQVADVRTWGTPPRVLYRAITSIEAPLRGFSNVRLLDASKMRVGIADLASEPIGQVLGLPASVTPSLAATLDMDFGFDAGTVWLERLPGPDPRRKQRVLVLGGGMGGLATAHALTDTDERRARFDVKVLSMGHYLGGKGANLRSREPAYGRRVEEHGIHVFFGFYHNALRLLRSVYADAARPPGVFPATFDEAFRPSLEVAFDDGTEKYVVRFPETPEGFGAGPISPKDLLEVFLDVLRDLFDFDDDATVLEMVATFLARRVGLRVGNRIADEVLSFALTLGVAVFRDLVVAGKTWDDLDAQDFRAWMRAHHLPGFPDLDDTAIMQVPYDGVFAYEGPDQSRPVLSAGVAARGLLKLVSDYEVAPIHTMSAGMGETVFMPLVEVLEARGVELEYFAKVKEIRVDRGVVREVVYGRQAVPRDGRYDPVERIDGVAAGEVRAWKHDPDRAQLVEDAIGDADPMSDAFDGQVGADVVLRIEDDFDWVVCALPAPVTASVLRGHAAIPDLARIASIPTVATLHLQAWFGDSLERLGWVGDGSRVLGGFPQPLNSMLTQEDILRVEAWHGADAPRGLLYLSGPFGGGWSTNSRDPVAREEAAVAAFREAATFVTSELAKVLPSAASGDAFDPAVLYAPLHPDDRLRDQYVRGNIDQHARYVLMKPGTLVDRPRAKPDGVENLCFAGDWVRTGIDIPCIEGTVVSALQAANAILGPDDAIDILW